MWAEECELDEEGSFPKTCLSQTCFDDETAKAPVTVTLVDEDEPSLRIDIDLRWTVGALRTFLSLKLNVEERGFRIKQVGGKECKDDSRLLRAEGFYRLMKLYLSSGTPPCVGDFYVKCFLLNPHGLKHGVKKLYDESVPKEEATTDGSGGGAYDITAENSDGEEGVMFENRDVQETAHQGDVDPFPMEV